MADLQSDIEIEDGKVSGTLSLVDLSALGYDDPGNFLVLQVSNENSVAGVTYTCTLTDSLGTDAIELDADGKVIIPVTSVDSIVTITAEKEGYVTDEVTLDLSDLTLLEE